MLVLGAMAVIRYAERHGILKYKACMPTSLISVR